MLCVGDSLPLLPLVSMLALHLRRLMRQTCSSVASSSSVARAFLELAAVLLQEAALPSTAAVPIVARRRWSLRNLGIPLLGQFAPHRFGLCRAAEGTVRWFGTGTGPAGSCRSTRIGVPAPGRRTTPDGASPDISCRNSNTMPYGHRHGRCSI